MAGHHLISSDCQQMHEAVTDLAATERTDRNSWATAPLQRRPYQGGIGRTRRRQRTLGEKRNRPCLPTERSLDARSGVRQRQHFETCGLNEFAHGARHAARWTDLPRAIPRVVPRAVLKEPKSRLLRDLNHRGSAILCNLAFPLQLRFGLFWLRRHELCKCLAD